MTVIARASETPMSPRDNSMASSMIGALSDWAELWRSKVELGSSVVAWASQLQPDSVFWKSAGGQLVNSVVEQFDVICCLGCRLHQVCPITAPERLHEWIEYAMQIHECWSARVDGEWESLIVGLARKGNALVSAAVCQSLKEATTSIRLPKSITSPLAPLVLYHLRWSQDLGIPPGSGCSRSPSDYLLYSENVEVLTRIQEFCRSIDAQLTMLLEIIAKIPEAVNREDLAEMGSHAKGVQVTTRELARVIDSAAVGWPIELSSMKYIGERLVSSLSERSSLAFSCPDVIKKIMPDREELHDVFAHCDQSVQTIKGSEFSSDVVTVSAVEEVPPSIGKGLSKLSQDVATSEEIPAQRLSVRLRQLASNWSDADASDGRSANRVRELLGCLLFLDTLVADSGVTSPWVIRARNDLRLILSLEGTYRLIDNELIGRPLDSCHSEAEPVGTIESNKVKSGHIAVVCQPGYALGDSSGRSGSLQKAQVLLAK